MPVASMVSAPTLRVRTMALPPWNQQQYSFCQPVFDSWPDMRERRRAGSLIVKMGGLGKYMVEGEFESWTCVYDDACALGGDYSDNYYFCYVFQESIMKFIPWDQHSNLGIFQPSR